jgi:hypothetical protein
MWESRRFWARFPRGLAEFSAHNPVQLSTLQEPLAYPEVFGAHRHKLFSQRFVHWYSSFEEAAREEEAIRAAVGTQ